jgi:hypothetical protein
LRGDPVTFQTTAKSLPASAGEVEAYHVPGAGIVPLECDFKWCSQTHIPNSGCPHFGGEVGGILGDRGTTKVLCQRAQYRTGAIPRVTCGDYKSEQDAVKAFDAAVEKSGCFSILREVAGKFLETQADQIVKDSPRIDRVLVPTPQAIEQGWDRGCIGIEVKRSGMKLGPPVAQLLDYMLCLWPIPGATGVKLSYGFLFPLGKVGHALGSIMAQKRIGGCWFRGEPSSPWYELAFYCGEQSRFIIYPNRGEIEIKNQSFGRKTGSR